MTLNEILEHSAIRSDRYALAAISHIYKAFGDNVRSKEYWPWGRDVQCEWYPSKGTNTDITEAELLLERARIKFEEEQKTNKDYSKINDDIMKTTFDKEIKKLRTRLQKVGRNIKTINKSNESIVKVSEETDSKIS